MHVHISSSVLDFSGLVLLSHEKNAQVQRDWHQWKMFAHLRIETRRYRTILILIFMVIRQRHFTLGGQKMPPYLTSEPNVMKTPNSACGLMFTKFLEKIVLS